MSLPLMPLSVGALFTLRILDAELSIWFLSVCSFCVWFLSLTASKS